MTPLSMSLIALKDRTNAIYTYAWFFVDFSSKNARKDLKIISL
jgi:hypothetical protein